MQKKYCVLAGYIYDAFPMPHVIFYVQWVEVIVHFVDIGGIFSST
jgi:hypothetical protein